MVFGRQPQPLTRRQDLYLSTVAGKGRGVFCSAAILAGEIIEIAPVMIFSEADSKKLAETLIGDYTFTGALLPADIAARAGIVTPDKASCFVMGLISYCNHRTVPNTVCSLESEYHTALFILRAKQDIAPGEEICINYGLGWFTTKRLNMLGKLLKKLNPGADNLT